MPITKQVAEKLVECYQYRELLQKQVEIIWKEPPGRTYEMTKYIEVAATQMTFTFTRDELAGAITRKQQALDKEIQELGGVP